MTFDPDQWLQGGLHIDEVAHGTPATLFMCSDEYHASEYNHVGDHTYVKGKKRYGDFEATTFFGVYPHPARVESIDDRVLTVRDEIYWNITRFDLVDNAGAPLPRPLQVNPPRARFRPIFCEWHVIVGIRIAPAVSCYTCKSEDKADYRVIDGEWGPWGKAQHDRDPHSWRPLFCEDCRARIASGVSIHDLLVEHGRIIVGTPHSP